MKLTLKEARKLVENAGPRMFRGSALILLEKMVAKTYNPTIDDPQRPITMKIKRIRKINVKERQFHNILKQLSAVVEIERQGGEITYKLNLEPLAKLNGGTDDTSSAATDKKHRTEAARNRRAEKRSNRRDAMSLMIAAGVAGGILPESIFAVAA